MGSDPGDDPLVHALIEPIDRDSGPPHAEPELSAENLAHLLGRLDASLESPPAARDSAERTSVERAFGASASGLFEVQSPASSHAQPLDTDPREGARSVSGAVSRATRRAAAEASPQGAGRPSAWGLGLVGLLCGLGYAAWWLAQPSETATLRPRVHESPPRAPMQDGPRVDLPPPPTEPPESVRDEPTAAPAPARATAHEGPVHRSTNSAEPSRSPRADTELTSEKRSGRRSDTPAPRAATLEVTTRDGKSAKIFLRQRLLGVAPGEMKLPPGRHHLLIRRADGVSYIRTVRSKPGSRVDLDLP